MKDTDLYIKSAKPDIFRDTYHSAMKNVHFFSDYVRIPGTFNWLSSIVLVGDNIVALDGRGQIQIGDVDPVTGNISNWRLSHFRGTGVGQTNVPFRMRYLGGYIYMIDHAKQAIQQFKLENGRLVLHSIFKRNGHICDFTDIALVGNYLVVGGGATFNYLSFKIDSKGNVTDSGKTFIPTGLNSLSTVLTCVAYGNQLISVDYAYKIINVYNVNQTTGEITASSIPQYGERSVATSDLNHLSQNVVAPYPYPVIHNGKLYVGGVGTGKVRELSLNLTNGVLTSISPVKDITFNINYKDIIPHPGGWFYITENGSAVLKYSSDFVYQSHYGEKSEWADYLLVPKGVYEDKSTGIVYGSAYTGIKKFSMSSNGRIFRPVHPGGDAYTSFGTAGNSLGKFSHIRDLCVIGNKIFTIDTQGYSMQSLLINSDGTITPVKYAGGYASTNPGFFYGPMDICARGTMVYVVELNSQRIQYFRFTEDGNFTVAGQYNTRALPCGCAIVQDKLFVTYSYTQGLDIFDLGTDDVPTLRKTINPIVSKWSHNSTGSTLFPSPLGDYLALTADGDYGISIFVVNLYNNSITEVFKYGGGRAGNTMTTGGCTQNMVMSQVKNRLMVTDVFGLRYITL